MKGIKAIVLMVALLIGVGAKADHDQVITYSQLPAKAQAMLKKYFANKVPLVVTVDWDDYTIIYESGEKVEFDKQGDWKEIECRASAVPGDLIPDKIKANVKQSYPGTSVIHLDRNRRGYEVKLNNGLEIEYDRTFQVIGIDD